MCQTTDEPTSISILLVLCPGPSLSHSTIKVCLINPCLVSKTNLLGRNRGLLELDLKLDDLLEMQKDGQEDLDLEYVQFNVSKVLALLNKRFARKKGW